MRFPFSRGLLSCGLTLAASLAANSQQVPTLNAPALDNHTVALPRDLAPATIFILGFGRHSSDQTTAWEKRVHIELSSPTIAFYDIAFIGDAPPFVRPMITRLIRNKVPALARPHFLVIADNQAAWKQLSSFDPKATDAAYVLLTDHTGKVIWSTHTPCSAEAFATLRAKAFALAKP